MFTTYGMQYTEWHRKTQQLTAVTHKLLTYIVAH